MATKNQILDNTVGLLLDRGCRALTMDEIASLNGVSKRTLYELFEDKSHLIEQALCHHSEQKSHYFERLMQESGNVMEMFLKSITYEDDRLIDLHFNLLSELKRYYPDVYSKVIEFIGKSQFETLKIALARGQEEGMIVKESLDIDTLAMMFITISKSVSDLSQHHFIKSGTIRAGRAVFLILLRGITTPKGLSIVDRYMEKHKRDIEAV